MHEIGIIAEIMKTVRRVMEENDATELETVVLDVGAICMAYPPYLEESFAAVNYKTEFEHVKLQINVIQANAQCRVCNTIFDIPEHDGVCPECQADRNYEILSGTELKIKEIHAN